ncbi:MAG: hypothetical protein DLM55_00615 [Acidimicrobiales bacterium]|nr:MAG: hypothetical protein DLM55_00615 [Acidimicrobiales bacterium]
MGSLKFSARITSDSERDSGRILEIGALSQSYVDLDNPAYLHFSYVQAIGAALDTWDVPGRPFRALHLGAGGLTLPRYLAHRRPGSSSLVAEIDPSVLRAAREELGFRDDTEVGNGIRVQLGDARQITAQQDTASYDLVIGDTFDAGFVPLHMITREFLSEVTRVLTHRGCYILNIIDQPPLDFFRSALATTLDTFDHTAVAARRSCLAGNRGNFVILAASVPLPIGELSVQLDHCSPPLDLAGDWAQLVELADSAPVLTDEFVSGLA